MGSLETANKRITERAPYLLCFGPEGGPFTQLRCPGWGAGSPRTRPAPLQPGQLHLQGLDGFRLFDKLHVEEVLPHWKPLLREL